MAKKRSWFNLVKRFFVSDMQSKLEKKDKRRKWMFFGRYKIRSKVPSITAPSPPRERTRLTEAEEEQSEHALNVVFATAAAAEAAVAAAHVAAEVVWLTGVPQSTHQCEKQTQEHPDIGIQSDSSCSTRQSKRDTQEFAAIKIQTAFRGYLVSLSKNNQKKVRIDLVCERGMQARKALRALRGIVKLQAIIRGRNVRRQAMHTLKCLQSIVNIQSQVCAKRTQRVEGICSCDENKQLQSLRDKLLKMDMMSQKRWDSSILTKEEADALFQSKKEAAIKRERIREYSFTHRNSAETDRSKLNGRWRYWLEQWVDTQLSKSKELEDLDSVITSDPTPKVEYRRKQSKVRGSQRQYQSAGSYSPGAGQERYIHRKQYSLGDDKSFPASPLVPTYMAATESAKAKARSLSSPRLRPGAFDAYSDSYSPSKNRLSLISSATTELPTSARYGRPSAYQQRSPSLKGLAGPIKSTRIIKDLSFDSDSSLRTWNHQTSFR
ncbi:hypothetical protein Tsubulata_049664 [Turnera subulata]|uniref:DUF4005 domain-containing protein n=1 Tax=Turnera subulata TaxID=218843 RepID=A0A9Q0FE51_9ROSI|nr:hypothetical protein Tsubulata_049664 [Turnera subulata]